jgi:N-acetylmuramoyl-L-alanine amidase
VKPAKAERPSPNHGPRPAGTPVDMLILHYTGMPDSASALERMCDPESQVSCHWLIEEDGTLWQLVEESRRAWHAGRGYWAGATDINSRSIGIELVNPGHEWGYRPFPPAQMTALAGLARRILARHPIPPSRVLGHSDVAPSRKQDPGELFDWAWLAEEGVGLWPDPDDLPTQEVDPLEGLARIGYGVGIDPEADIVAAFQRHYRPWQVDGVLDDETRRRIAQLIAADSD